MSSRALKRLEKARGKARDTLDAEKEGQANTREERYYETPTSSAFSAVFTAQDTLRQS